MTTQPTITTRGRVAQKIAEIGSCLELVPTDPHFGGVSVGLYVKDGVCTVWSFSHAAGVGERLRAIRDQMVKLGGVEPVDGSGQPVCLPVRDDPRQAGQVPADSGGDQESRLRPPRRPDEDQGLQVRSHAHGHGHRGRGPFCLPGLGRGRNAEPSAATADGGRRIRALRRDGEGRRHGGRVSLRPDATTSCSGCSCRIRATSARWSRCWKQSRCAAR